MSQQEQHIKLPRCITSGIPSAFFSRMLPICSRWNTVHEHCIDDSIKML